MAELCGPAYADFTRATATMRAATRRQASQERVNATVDLRTATAKVEVLASQWAVEAATAVADAADEWSRLAAANSTDSQTGR